MQTLQQTYLNQATNAMRALKAECEQIGGNRSVVHDVGVRGSDANVTMRK
jgi:hypothetical protein